MKIQILGAGCVSCKNLYEKTQKVVKDLNIKAEVEYIDDIKIIIEKGFMQSPVLLCDEEVISVGKNLSESEIKELFTK